MAKHGIFFYLRLKLLCIENLWCNLIFFHSDKNIANTYEWNNNFYSFYSSIGKAKILEVLGG